MDRIAVNSSVISSMSYNPKTRQLVVQFNSGQLYCYLEVPELVYRAFLNSESKGRFFEGQIRGKYEYEHLDD